MGQLERRQLSDSEIADALVDLGDWSREGDEIVRVYEFETYKDGIVFASAAGFLADNMDHHPEMKIGYRRVEVRLTTHSVEGISPFDIEMAEQIDWLVS